jgi:uncharacterized alkaline shock family protein YloU
MMKEVEPAMGENQQNRYSGNEMEQAGHEDVVRVSDDVIATIATMALGEVKGVAAASTGLVGGLLGRKGPAKGIKIEADGNAVSLDVTIMVEYGARIPDVAADIQRRLRSAIEEMTGKFVRAINVTVQGIRGPSGAAISERADEAEAGADQAGAESPEDASGHTEPRQEG